MRGGEKEGGEEDKNAGGGGGGGGGEGSEKGRGGRQKMRQWGRKTKNEAVGERERRGREIKSG